MRSFLTFRGVGFYTAAVNLRCECRTECDDPIPRGYVDREPTASEGDVEPRGGWSVRRVIEQGPRGENGSAGFVAGNNPDPREENSNVLLRA